MEDQVQYGMTDLRPDMEGRPFLPPPELLSFTQPYDMLMFGSSSAAAGRWPRQETLTLLDIRSRLDPKFKDANHKGPLWDEVSRIMSEENGYQRSGKKCREKFENLYKYYKKTKEGRQDGKHYRFFTQLEALYSHSTTHFHGRDFPKPNSLPSDQEICPGSKISDTSLISAPDSGDYDTTSTYCSDNDDSREKKKRRGRRRSLKAKIEESIDAQMKNMMEKQEAWMEKMAKAIESKERDRAMREEQWRKQDAARIEREHEMWASERAWIEARDIAFLDAFNKLSGKELEFTAGDLLPESEVSRLIQPMSGMDSIGVQENRIPQESAWDKMGCSGSMCREKWDQIINQYVMKKRKDNPKSCCTYSSPFLDHGVEENGYGNEPPNEGYFMGDSYQRLS